MEQSKALSRMLEAADLVTMLEDLTAAASGSKLSPASMSGMRLTLRNIREAILASHDTFASSLVSLSRVATENMQSDEQESDTDSTQAIIKRKDLRASLEKFIDK